MTVRLYTEADLKAVRRVEAVGHRMDAASEAYKALYHSLDSIETGGNADALRIARRSICEANSILMGQVREIVEAESSRIIESEVGIPEVEEIGERIQGLKRDLEAPSPREGLRCCPICARRLTWDDVSRSVNADGIYVAVECECGFSFASPASDAEDWKGSFAQSFNRREGL